MPPSSQQLGSDVASQPSPPQYPHSASRHPPIAENLIVDSVLQLLRSRPGPGAMREGYSYGNEGDVDQDFETLVSQLNASELRGILMRAVGVERNLRRYNQILVDAGDAGLADARREQERQLDEARATQQAHDLLKDQLLRALEENANDRERMRALGRAFEASRNEATVVHEMVSLLRDELERCRQDLANANGNGLSLQHDLSKSRLAKTQADHEISVLAQQLQGSRNETDQANGTILELRRQLQKFREEVKAAQAVLAKLDLPCSSNGQDGLNSEDLEDIQEQDDHFLVSTDHHDLFQAQIGFLQNENDVLRDAQIRLQYKHQEQDAQIRNLVESNALVLTILNADRASQEREQSQSLSESPTSNSSSISPGLEWSNIEEHEHAPASPEYIIDSPEYAPTSPVYTTEEDNIYNTSPYHPPSTIPQRNHNEDVNDYIEFALRSLEWKAPTSPPYKPCSPRLNSDLCQNEPEREQNLVLQPSTAGYASQSDDNYSPSTMRSGSVSNDEIEKTDDEEENDPRLHFESSQPCPGEKRSFNMFSGDNSIPTVEPSPKRGDWGNNVW